MVDSKSFCTKLFHFILTVCLLFYGLFLPIFQSNTQIVFAETTEQENVVDDEDNSSEDEEITNISYSVFINSPTYAYIYSRETTENVNDSNLNTDSSNDGNETNANDESIIDDSSNSTSTKLYFIDNSPDPVLKSYDFNTGEFAIELKDLFVGNIIDACFDNGKIFILTASNSEEEFGSCVIIIDLTNEEISVKKLNLDKIYSKISATSITYSTDSMDESSIYEFVSLTPNAWTENSLPKLIVLNSLLEVQNEIEISFNNIVSSIAGEIFKILTYPSSITDGINIIYAYGTTLSYSNCEISSFFDSETIDIQSTYSLPVSLDNTNSENLLTNINFIKIDEEDYLAVSYYKFHLDEPDALTVIYSFDLTYSNNVAFINKKEVSTATVSYDEEYQISYVTTCDNYIVYPSNQKIQFCKLSLSEDIILSITDSIENPSVNKSYYEIENFIYVTASVDTEILQNPWSTTAITQVNAGDDLIIIAETFIDKINISIEDYKYCFYTSGGVNYTGFVKYDSTENGYTLEKKDTSSIPESIKTCTVTPNTALYTFPTKVLKSEITNFTLEILMEIPNDSRIDVLDTICDYTADGTRFIKVQVNFNQIGYIDYNQINFPSEYAHYILTNASIKNDNTNVYLEPNDSSVVKYILQAGKQVRIDGDRDTTSGYTYITFNDEWGNEFSGYIKTDYIVTDSWTILQIIGCILIAINIGLLILILYYRDTRIGYRGQKYEKSKKSN